MRQNAKNIISYLVCSILILSCMQNLNSNSNDSSFRPSRSFDPSTPEGQRYGAAMNVLENRCNSCHGGDWAALTTEEAWSASIYVVKNNSLASILYTSNKGSNGNGTKDMPLVGNLSASELNALATWIDEML